MEKQHMPLAGRLTVRKTTPAVRAAEASRAAGRWRLRNALARWREWPLEVALWLAGVGRRVVPGLNLPVHSRLFARVLRGNGTIEDLGCVSVHLITTAGKNFVTGAFDNTNEVENLKYHGFGTGTTAAAIGDTALQTELTTQYATNSTRPTGSQVVSTNTYTTVATLTPDAAVAITEWGLLSQAATGGGTLFDRAVFSAVNLNGTGDQLQVTYVLTVG